MDHLELEPMGMFNWSMPVQWLAGQFESDEQNNGSSKPPHTGLLGLDHPMMDAGSVNGVSNRLWRRLVINTMLLKILRFCFPGNLPEVNPLILFITV